MTATKPFQISKQIVWESWLQVKRSKGSPGYDNENLDIFEKDLKK